MMMWYQIDGGYNYDEYNCEQYGYDCDKFDTIKFLIAFLTLPLIPMFYKNVAGKNAFQAETLNASFIDVLFAYYLQLPSYSSMILLFDGYNPVGYMLFFLGWMVASMIIFRVQNIQKSKKEKDIDNILMESEKVYDLAKKYAQVRIQVLKKDIDTLSPQNIDEKVKDALRTDIDRFAELLELNDIHVRSRDALIEHIFEVTEPIRSDLRNALREHLSAQLLVAEEERPVIELDDMIDNLLTDFMKMETTGTGKTS
jgi:hypothetical protein